MALSKKDRQEQKKKGPTFQGPLTIDNVRKSRAMFAARSRRTYTGKAQLPDGTTLADVRRLVFGVHLDILDFAGSLLDKNDKESFATQFQELTRGLSHYQKNMGDMFPEEHRESMLAYINDVAAGAYDMADSFLNIAAEHRPVLLNLVNRYIKGELTVEHVLDVPQELLDPVPDQTTTSRLYGEYYEKGYRIRHYNNADGSVSDILRKAMPYRVPDYTRREVQEQAVDMLANCAKAGNIPAVGVVYKYFEL